MFLPHVEPLRGVYFCSSAFVWSPVVLDVCWLQAQPLDNIQTLMMGHTNSPETLVPDHNNDAGQKPKNCYTTMLLICSYLHNKKLWMSHVKDNKKKIRMDLDGSESDSVLL
jgi:hypothetical protein